MTPLRLSIRMVRRGTIVWMAVAAGIVAVGSVTYARLYPTDVSKGALVSLLGHNRAFAALQGQAVRIDTTGGFVVWKYVGLLTVLVALWAVLTTTKLLRGDEELGRSDLLIAGPTNITGQLASQLGVMMVAVTCIGGAVAASGITSGLAVGGSVLLGFTIASGGWVFGAIAALCGQLLSTRRQANAMAGVILGISFLVRAVATGSARYWLCWVSPIGWSERLSPFSSPRYIAMILVAFSTISLGAATLWLRGRRDTGEGLVSLHVRVKEIIRPLTSVLELDWRLMRGTALGWSLGASVVGFVLGFLAVGVSDYAHQDHNFSKIVSEATNSSVTSVSGFLGLTFSEVAIVLAIFAGTMIVRTREEEGRGHADVLLCSGASRARLVASRIAIAVLLVGILAILASCAAWAGTAVSGTSASNFADTLRGGLNTVPLALLFGGISMLAFGIVPRLTSIVRFVSVGLAYGIVLIGGSLKAPKWFMAMSPFTHLAPVPAAPANIGALVAMMALAGVTGLAGAIAFLRRDIQVE